jgi:hypothetical protein
MLAGFEQVVGVEIEANYLPYARARVQFWHEHRGASVRDVARAVRKAQQVQEVSGQRSLW